MSRLLTGLSNRLTLISMAATASALALTFGFLILLEFFNFQKNAFHDLESLSLIFNTTCGAALNFNDEKDAQSTLQTLEVEPGLVSAAIYKLNGSLFAGQSFHGPFDPVLDLDPRNFHSFSFKKFAHVQPILYDGKPVGYLKLVSSTSHMREELVLYFKVFTFAALLALLTSSQISRRLQNSVSQPILALVAASRSSASGRQMVQVQAPKAEPEIAELVEAFNKMVQEIDRRARELEQANLTLESRVNQRTRELAEAILEAQRVRHLAESASESKTRFLNNMSHELRTPLTAIIGYTRLLAEELEKGNLDGATRDVATVEFSAKHLLGLISNILDLSKIESGKMEVQCETFDPLQLLTDCARTFEPLCHENGNRLELDLQSLPSAINTDKTKLRQILFNLLSNAAKFTESGVITLRARKNEPYFEIRVCDTGAGMNPDQIKRAFEPFQSAGQSRLVEGSGLGLTIVYSFCRMLQGTFEIKSEPGKGTQCIARLPLHPFHHS